MHVQHGLSFQETKRRFESRCHGVLARAGAEDAVVADEMEARRRHQGRELLDELLRREDDVRRAAAPAVLQAVEEAAVVEA